MAEEKYFRGYWAIKEVLDKTQPLAAYLSAHKPTCKRMTMKRKDYDLVCRWPEAAKLHGFAVVDGELMLGEFTIKPDKSPARYERPAPISSTL